MTDAPQAPVRRRVPKPLALLTLLLAVATVFAGLSTLHWFLELFSHFTPYYVIAVALCVVALYVVRAWHWLFLALALLMWNGYPVVRALLREAAPPAVALRQFTVFHFNAGTDNDEPNRVAAYVQQHAREIDVVVLLEASRDFEATLDDLRDNFPYQVRSLEDSPFGIALASKHMLDFSAVSYIPSEAFPHIEVNIRLPLRAAPLALFAIHAPPPISAAMADARNAKLRYVAQAAAAQAAATPLVVGDFNLTPWSPYFRRFAAASGLADARNAHRFDHTWPVVFGDANLGIALDHSFAHRALRMVKRTLGPDLGSDHLPVTVTYSY